MTLVVIALVMIAAGIVLRSIAHSAGDRSKTLEVTKMGNDGSNENRREELLTMRREFPGLPAVPMRPMEFDGWVQEVRKRLVMRTLGLTVVQETRLQQQLNALQDARLTGVKTETQLQEALSELAIAQRRAMQRAESTDAIQKKQAERDLLTMEVEVAKLQKELCELKNPSRPPQQPARESREEKFFAEWRRLQEQRTHRIAECKGDPKCEEMVNLFFDNEEGKLKEGT